MDADWQSWAAAGVVVLTALVFLRRTFRKKKGGCSTCGNSTPPVKRN